MKHHGIAICRRRQALDLETFIEMPGVTATYCYNSCCGSFVRFYFYRVQLLTGSGQADLYKVIFQSWNYYFRFRIAKPAVVFYNIRIIVHLDQADKYYSLVVDLFLL